MPLTDIQIRRAKPQDKAYTRTTSVRLYAGARHYPYEQNEAGLLATQDIHLEDVMIVFDLKGDADLFRHRRGEAVRVGRSDLFMLFSSG